MQTRRLRLGDVVDDYCPRERRLSNHVIAAMVDDTIKQTRCSTCDFEHPYKEAKIPARRRKKDATSELFQQVLDNVTEGMKPSATAASDETAAAVTSAPVPEQVALVPAAAVSEPVPEAPPAPAPRRRASKRTAAAAASAPLFPAESETPAPAAIASAAPAPAPAAPSPERPVATPAVVAASAGTKTRAAASAARPAASTPASTGLPPATLVKTPATPAPAARAAASAPASPAPAALVTAPRGVLRPAAPRETPAGAAANQPSALAASPAAPDADGNAAEPAKEEDAPLHRRALIRATLPRPVGEVPVRAIPTFTIREAAAARPNKFRHKGRPNGAARQSRAPIGPMSMGNNQARPGNTRGPQGRGGAAKKAGGHQPHRAGGHQPPRGQKGPQGGGGKRFK